MHPPCPFQIQQPLKNLQKMNVASRGHFFGMLLGQVHILRGYDLLLQHNGRCNQCAQHALSIGLNEVFTTIPTIAMGVHTASPSSRLALIILIFLEHFYSIFFLDISVDEMTRISKPMGELPLTSSTHGYHAGIREGHHVPLHVIDYMLYLWGSLFLGWNMFNLPCSHRRFQRTLDCSGF